MVRFPKAEQDKASADVRNNAALLKQAEANVLVAEQVLKTAQVAKTGLSAQVQSALKLSLTKHKSPKTTAISLRPWMVNWAKLRHA